MGLGTQHPFSLADGQATCWESGCSLTPGAAGYSQDGGRCTGSEPHLSAGSAPPSELPHLKSKDTWVSESGPAHPMAAGRKWDKRLGLLQVVCECDWYHNMTGKTLALQVAGPPMTARVKGKAPGCYHQPAQLRLASQGGQPVPWHLQGQEAALGTVR